MEIMATGTLYLIGIPIGNLKDLTPRAKEILNDLKVLACEDTRITARFLKDIEIEAKKELIPVFEHNERLKTPFLLKKLEEGQDIGLVVSRGTPLISDPGYFLTREAIKKGISIKVIPGASALLCGLLLSGLPPDKFIFLGFPPRKDQKQKNFFEKYKDLDVTLVFYESPRRVMKTLKNLEPLFSDWYIAICRELTKTYEEVLRGTYSQVLAVVEKKELLGECTILLSKKV